MNIKDGFRIHILNGDWRCRFDWHVSCDESVRGRIGTSGQIGFSWVRSLTAEYALNILNRSGGTWSRKYAEVGPTLDKSPLRGIVRIRE